MIALTCKKIPDQLSKQALGQAAGLLFSHPDNQSYIENIINRKSDTSATESLFALAILFDLLSSLPCRVEPDKLIFAKDENGKPYFLNSDIKFNISHSKGYVACALSNGEELGIDIEAGKLTEKSAEKLYKRFLSCGDESNISLSTEEIIIKWCEAEAKAKFLSQSVGNLFCDLKNNKNNDADIDVIYHRFFFESIPIILCTKRNFSTINYIC